MKLLYVARPLLQARADAQTLSRKQGMMQHHYSKHDRARIHTDVSRSVAGNLTGAALQRLQLTVKSFMHVTSKHHARDIETSCT